MKIKKLKIPAVLSVLLAAVFALSGCGGTDRGKNRTKTYSFDLAHYDQMTEDQDYNRGLFFQNDLTTKAADPSVIYIDHGEEKGYFYMYGTSSSQIGATGYQAWRSKDLSRWECTGVAYVQDRNTWATTNYWAPEVIYYQTPEEKEAGEDGKYYLFHNAQNIFNGNRHSVGLAVSDHPAGPFIQYTGTQKLGGWRGDREVTISDPFLNSDLFPSSSYIYQKPLIDASPFIDYDDDGNPALYLYLTLDRHDGGKASSIWGMRLTDMFTPDYDSIVQITEYNRVKPGGTEPNGETDSSNEGPFVYRHGDRYYMTFSVSFYEKPSYSVAQAVSSSPLGTFRKIDHKKGGKLLTSQVALGEDYHNHMTGTGHHSFIKVGDELFISYHAFVDRYAGNIGEGRAIACDRVSFINNGEEEILYVNGPSYSLQPLPAENSGYGNIASKAKVSATNVKSGLPYLTDYRYKNHNYDFVGEFEANGNETEITFKFDKKYKVRAIMVYNSYNYYNSFTEIDSIQINTNVIKKNNETASAKAFIKNLAFNVKRYMIEDIYRDEEGNMVDESTIRPGGSAIAEFNEIETDLITITVKGGKKNFEGILQNLMISDIVILGK